MTWDVLLLVWFTLSTFVWAWQVQNHFGRGLKGFAIFSLPILAVSSVTVLLINV